MLLVGCLKCRSFFLSFMFASLESVYVCAGEGGGGGRWGGCHVCFRFWVGGGEGGGGGGEGGGGGKSHHTVVRLPGRVFFRSLHGEEALGDGGRRLGGWGVEKKRTNDATLLPRLSLFFVCGGPRRRRQCSHPSLFPILVALAPPRNPSPSSLLPRFFAKRTNE